MSFLDCLAKEISLYVQKNKSLPSHNVFWIAEFNIQKPSFYLIKNRQVISINYYLD